MRVDTAGKLHGLWLRDASKHVDLDRRCVAPLVGSLLGERVPEDPGVALDAGVASVMAVAWRRQDIAWKPTGDHRQAGDREEQGGAGLHGLYLWNHNPPSIVGVPKSGIPTKVHIAQDDRSS